MVLNESSEALRNRSDFGRHLSPHFLFPWPRDSFSPRSPISRPRVKTRSKTPIFGLLAKEGAVLKSSFIAARARLKLKSEAKLFPKITSLVELFYVTGRTFFVGNLWKRSVFPYFRTFVNFFGQNEWHICFSQPILR